MKRAKFALIMYPGDSDMSVITKSNIARSLSSFDNIDLKEIQIIEFAPTEIDNIVKRVKNYAKEYPMIGITINEISPIKTLLNILGYTKFPESLFVLRLKIAETISDNNKRMDFLNALKNVIRKREIWRTKYARNVAMNEKVYKTLKEAVSYYFE